MVHGTRDERIERLLEEAAATLEPERPHRALPRRPHLPRRAGAWPMRASRENGK
ncbi:hypothetical protein [Azospirillum sp. ST 5-10]|uniref:hypothetical protein n=1 Tax=unclassified Azospirillum TaxID=2630922 RepID=UPI003F4A527B